MSHLTADNDCPYCPAGAICRHCPGSGRLWGSGTGNPVCPVCHYRPAGQNAARPRRRLGRWSGTVPAHYADVPTYMHDITSPCGLCGTF